MTDYTSASDSDPDGDTIAVTAVTGVAGSDGGLFSIAANGDLTYTPALNANGTLKAAGDLPDILERRVNREVDFSSFFGTPFWL